MLLQFSEVIDRVEDETGTEAEGKPVKPVAARHEMMGVFCGSSVLETSRVPALYSGDAIALWDAVLDVSFNREGSR